MDATVRSVIVVERIAKLDSRSDSISARGQDCENQLAQLRQFARHAELDHPYEYVDHPTGKHSDREQFQRLFLDASQRQFDLALSGP